MALIILLKSYRFIIYHLSDINYSYELDQNGLIFQFTHTPIAVFNYPSGQDSVIQVNNKDYESCNTDASAEKFSDGHTVIKLTQSGPHFFISGNKNNCLKNEKLVVTVMADRTNKNSNNNQTTTPPSPSPSVSPSPSPLPTHSTDSVLVPSQAPIQQEVPPPPAAASPPAPVTDVTNTNPTSAPVSEPPPSTPNAASSILVGFVGSVGALMASILVFSKWSIYE